MTDTYSWYQQLKKPGWAPPVSLFGQVWSVLYLIIFAVNAYVVSQVLAGRLDWWVGLPFWLNLVFNVVFTPLQFGLRSNLLACIDIVLIGVTIIWAMVAIWPHARWAALAFVPYLIWVAIATTLQFSITWLNR